VRSGDGLLVCVRCVRAYRRGRFVALTASPSRHFRFSRWRGDCVGTAPRCIIALDNAATVRAIFEREEGVLSVMVRGSGSVAIQPAGVDCATTASAPSVTCFATFGEGEAIRLVAMPGEGQVFEGWSGGCRRALAPTCRLRVEQSNTLTATFRRAVPEPGPQPLTVLVREGFSGPGQIKSVPPGIDCPPICGALFPSRTLVTLHRRFGFWSGTCAGTSPCSILIDGPTVVAGDPPPPVPGASAGERLGISVSVSGPGRVESVRAPLPRQLRCGSTSGARRDCQAFLDAGSAIRLRALPARRGRFVRWSGFCRGQRTRSCRLRLNAPKTALAVFRRRR
jgi:hypothetical protein